MHLVSLTKFVTALVSVLPMMRSWMAWILTSTLVARRRMSWWMAPKLGSIAEVFFWIDKEFHLEGLSEIKLVGYEGERQRTG